MKKIILGLGFTFVIIFAQAQFEQKFTAQLSGGYSFLLGDDDGISRHFGNGVTIDAGVQYNFSRPFSLVALLKYGMYFLNTEEFQGLEGEYTNLGISFCPKYKFLADKTLQPYVFGGINLNFISFRYEFNYP